MPNTPFPMPNAHFPTPYIYEKTRFDRADALFVEFISYGYNLISQVLNTLLRRLKGKLHKQLRLTLLLLHAASLTI